MTAMASEVLLVDVHELCVHASSGLVSIVPCCSGCRPMAAECLRVWQALSRSCLVKWIGVHHNKYAHLAGSLSARQSVTPCLAVPAACTDGCGEAGLARF